jgi:hypothetical protein
MEKLIKNKWTEYGKALHPLEWWQNALTIYLKMTNPEKLQYNPTVIKVTEEKIHFGMRSHYGILILSKEKIENTIYG